jgi:hypothetical protein
MNIETTSAIFLKEREVSRMHSDSKICRRWGLVILIPGKECPGTPFWVASFRENFCDDVPARFVTKYPWRKLLTKVEGYLFLHTIPRYK